MEYSNESFQVIPDKINLFPSFSWPPPKLPPKPKSLLAINISTSSPYSLIKKFEKSFEIVA
uniref:Uncharacterized protein n=1 Tax=Meloidogyne enterolobii TaxID=390850 RepID=A0A6V7XDT1_MELEN|nr:unnamed protein product [Meloidogyne enterolobii]